MSKEEENAEVCDATMFEEDIKPVSKKKKKMLLFASYSRNRFFGYQLKNKH